MRRTPRARAFFATFTALVVGTAAVPAMSPIASEAGPCGSHPYFDDQGTLSWSTSLDAAVASARAADKLVFIEYGRRECRNCKLLVQTILPACGVRERASAACVGLAADCDEPDPRVEAIFRTGLPCGRTLPFVGIVTSDLRWVTGWQGCIGADEVVGHLALAEACRSCRRTVVATRTGPPMPPATLPMPRPVAAAPVVPPAPAAPKLAAAPQPAPNPVGPLATAPSPIPVPPSTPGTRDLATLTPRVPLAASATPGGLPVAPPPSAAAALEAAKRQAMDLLARARAADAVGAHAAVLWLDSEAARLAVRAEPESWTLMVGRASGWCEGCLRAAVDATRARRCSEANGLLASLRRDAAGRPAAADAEHGELAVSLVKQLDAMAPADRSRARAVVRTQFAGTRWAAVFED
jgi:hypothetical protein